MVVGFQQQLKTSPVWPCSTWTLDVGIRRGPAFAPCKVLQLRTILQSRFPLIWVTQKPLPTFPTAVYTFF